MRGPSYRPPRLRARATRPNLVRFADEALARPQENGSRPEKEGSNEARIVAAYLRRRQAVVEAVRLNEARDLLKAAERVAEAAAPLA